MDRQADSEQPEATDAAALAFDRLRGEVALLHNAIAGMSADRARIEIPDYSETLAKISGNVRTIGRWLDEMKASPALALTPQEIGRQMAAAGKEGRDAETSALRQAQTEMFQAAGELRQWTESARSADQQNRRLLQVGVAGLVGGAILCAALGGPVIALFG